MTRFLPYRSFPAAIQAADVGPAVRVFEDPLMFSQTGVLDEQQFVSGAKVRGVDLNADVLELLHRRRLLIPLFVVHQRPVEPSVPIHWEPWGDSRHRELLIAASEGRVSDPVMRRFRPWPKGERVGARYSRFQLLGLRSTAFTLSALRSSRSNDEITHHLDSPQRGLVDLAVRTRALAVVLEALATRYLPRILDVIKSPSDEIDKRIWGTDLATELRLIEPIQRLLRPQAEALLAHASHFDPLGRWHRVTRIARPSRWEDLRFDALLAMEQRIAAEMLLECREDIASSGQLDALPPVGTTFHEPRHDRLSTTVRERAETVLDFGLADAPSLILAVEGETEMELVRRALEEIGVDTDAALIRLVNFKGVDSDFNLLARSLAVPRVDPDGYRGARLLAPLNALLLVVDREGPFRTLDGQEKKRQQAIDEVMNSLLPELRTPAMRADLDHVIQVRDWGQKSFEFAHFSDHEIASALMALAGSASPPLVDVRERVAQARAGGENLKSVYKGWRISISKVDLAVHLWPKLEARMRLPSRRRPVPIVSVLEDAVDLALKMRPIRELAPDDSGR